MAYSPLVPNANNTVGSDLTAMQENFSLLESAQVVDEGSTVDGDYIRYENGWQICFAEKVVSFNSDSQINVIFNFPVNFISGGSYSLTAMAINSGSSLFYCSGDNRSDNATTIYVSSYNRLPTTDDINTNYLAIGRWK